MFKKSRLAAISLMVIFAGTTSAQVCDVPVPGEIFCDDFGEETATFADGRPVHWGSGAVGRVQEVDGSLELTPTPGSTFYSGFVPGVTHTDASIRTQFRMSDGSIQNAGVKARERTQPGDWYMALLQSDGGLQIHSVIEFQGNLLGEVRLSDIDPVMSDVNMQFDLVGDVLSLTVWPEPGLKPSAPQLVVQDAMILDGQAVGVWMQGGSNDSSTAYRFFEVVPEPSAMSMLLVGLLLMRRRFAV